MEFYFREKKYQAFKNNYKNFGILKMKSDEKLKTFIRLGHEPSSSSSSPMTAVIRVACRNAARQTNLDKTLTE